MRFAERTSLLAICGALLACAQPDSAAKDSARVDSIASPAAGQTAPTRSQEIYIDSVTAGNPIVVHGRARTFENTVQLRARDATGNVIAENFTTSRGEMGHHNPYSSPLWIPRDPGPRMTVEAFEYSANDGSERSLTSTVIPSAQERMPVTLLFPVGDRCTETRPFARVVPRTVAVSRLLVEALAAGPDSAEKAAGASSPFPRGSRVNSVVLRDGTLTVDFNERLQNVGGACAATAIRHSVMRTLERLSTVKRVVITAGGSEKLALQP